MLTVCEYVNLFHCTLCTFFVVIVATVDQLPTHLCPCKSRFRDWVTRASAQIISFSKCQRTSLQELIFTRHFPRRCSNRVLLPLLKILARLPFMVLETCRGSVHTCTSSDDRKTTQSAVHRAIHRVAKYSCYQHDLSHRVTLDMCWKRLIIFLDYSDLDQLLVGG